MILLTGILGNSFSLCYFLTAASRNTNAEFFRRLYSAVTLVDLLISILSIPIAEAAFREGRDGVMFTNPEFCGVWSCLWSLLYMMSIFLVGMLSAARLIILKFPFFRLKPVLAWIVPAFFGICWLSMLVVLRTTGFSIFFYRKTLLACVDFGFKEITQTAAVINHKEQLSVSTNLFLRMMLPVSVFILILMTFILLLTRLLRLSWFIVLRK